MENDNAVCGDTSTFLNVLSDVNGTLEQVTNYVVQVTASNGAESLWEWVPVIQQWCFMTGVGS